MKRWIITITLIVGVILFLYTQADAAEETIKMNVTFGIKAVTKREFDVIAEKELEAMPGKKTAFKVKDDYENIDAKIEITPTISSENPEMVLFDIKGWRKKTIYKDGSSQQKYVTFLQGKSKAVMGATIIIEKRLSQQDIQLTIRPYK